MDMQNISSEDKGKIEGQGQKTPGGTMFNP